MLGQLNKSSRKVTVVGGGVAGLLISYTLDRAGYEVELLEASSRLGGMIESRDGPLGLSEAAAHSLLVTEAVKDLCHDLRVELVPVQVDSRARYIWRAGKSRKFPLTFFESIEALGRACWIANDPAKHVSELTVADWAKRHLGPGALHYLFDPMLQGIYASSPHEILIEAAFPSLLLPEGRSLVGNQVRKKLAGRRGEKGKKMVRQMMAPRLGMSQIPQALAGYLRERLGDRLKMNTEFHSLIQSSEPRNIILAVPAQQAAKILKSVDPVLSESLLSIPYAPLVSVTVFADRKDFLKKIPSGVGVLVPSQEKRNVLGVLFNSSSFPERVKAREDTNDHQISLTVMLGGSSRPDILNLSDMEIRAILKSELRDILGYQFNSDGSGPEMVIHRWPRAIPQYGKALVQAWSAARQGWCSRPGQLLFGNYTGQVSIRGMIETAAAFDAN
jgi:oxygen-dependent protoporphyrinogen oxidase